MYDFSKWVSWHERNKLSDIEFPGIYVIALSKKNISEEAFSWIQEIIYVGMTNSKGGLKSRLQQFDYTVHGGDGHGGGHRVLYKHKDYSRLTNQLYVSVSPQKCDVTSNTPSDLRVMGKVANHEYECFAQFVEAFGSLPEFNDKQRSPKK